MSSITKIAKSNAKVFLDMYADVLDGDVYSPREQEIREVRDYKFSIDPRYPLTSFKDRKLSKSYLAAELCWYLRGDRYDLSICEHGSMWSKLIQADNGLNSNYGQTIFGIDKQMLWCCEELVRDPDSRRAVMIIGEKRYLHKDVNDQRCCQYIQFMIRDNKLECYVYFRSNDVAWGISNDVFTLVELFKFVYATINTHIPKLKLGMYNHTATSLHVYERHYKMLDDIIKKGMRGFYEIPFVNTSDPIECNWLSNNSSNKDAEAPSFMSYASLMMEWINDK